MQRPPWRVSLPALETTVRPWCDRALGGVHRADQIQDEVRDIPLVQSRHACVNRDVPCRLEWGRAARWPLQSPDHKSIVVSDAEAYSSERGSPLGTRQSSPPYTAYHKHPCLHAAPWPENSAGHTKPRSVQKICECR